MRTRNKRQKQEDSRNNCREMIGNKKLQEVCDASVWRPACSRTHLDGEKYFYFSEQTLVKLPPKLPSNLPRKFCASRKNTVQSLIIKEGLEPEALDEISLKVGESMEI
jgi:hypothetical protein